MMMPYKVEWSVANLKIAETTNSTYSDPAPFLPARSRAVDKRSTAGGDDHGGKIVGKCGIL
jgi:hypothetical protein